MTAKTLRLASGLMSGTGLANLAAGVEAYSRGK
jgi:hypothetical protein